MKHVMSTGYRRFGRERNLFHWMPWPRLQGQLEVASFRIYDLTRHQGVHIARSSLSALFMMHIADNGVQAMLLIPKQVPISKY